MYSLIGHLEMALMVSMKRILEFRVCTHLEMVLKESMLHNLESLVCTQMGTELALHMVDSLEFPESMYNPVCLVDNLVRSKVVVSMFHMVRKVQLKLALVVELELVESELVDNLAYLVDMDILAYLADIDSLECLVCSVEDVLDDISRHFCDQVYPMICSLSVRLNYNHHLHHR